MFVAKRLIPLSLSERLVGDVGGQRTLRPYWRNYFEQTDALVWVVDSSDRLRLGDCKEELHSLLLEDVRTFILFGDLPWNVTVSFRDWQAHPCLSSLTSRTYRAP
jgi:GTPase SAR1 family protein